MEEEIKRYGFIYQLLKRDGKKALYCQKLEDKIVGYEVQQLASEDQKFPRHEDFGYTAWSFRSLEEAQEFYKELIPTNKGQMELPF